MAATVLLDSEYRRGLEPHCVRCVDDHDARARWGCDEPLPDPWDFFECWRCKALPAAHREDCDLCGGQGRVGVYRCPWSMIGPRERFVVQAVVLLEAGLLPHPGGWGDQPAGLLDAMNVVGAEKRDLERRELERASNR